mgnify:CR=1 FL=1|jgi:hypothetical protein|tara:strand:- start:610 stop:966 length:357 start_codon:yes stop_codon:yes gene_type:complete
MKITKKQLIKLIQEEMSLVKLGDTPQNNPITGQNEPYFDHPDDEGDMAKRQLQQLSEYSNELSSMLSDDQQLESWVQNKITKAVDYISTVKHHLEYEMGEQAPEGCGCTKCSSDEPCE